MSIDICFQDWGNYETLKEIPDSFEPKPIGHRSDIVKKIKSFNSEIIFNNLEWGIYETKNYSIEFNMGSKEELNSFVLHIREVIGTKSFILELCHHLKLRASDGVNIYGKI